MTATARQKGLTCKKAQICGHTQCTAPLECYLRFNRYIQYNVVEVFDLLIKLHQAKIIDLEACIMGKLNRVTIVNTLQK